MGYLIACNRILSSSYAFLWIDAKALLNWYTTLIISIDFLKVTAIELPSISKKHMV